MVFITYSTIKEQDDLIACLKILNLSMAQSKVVCLWLSEGSRARHNKCASGFVLSDMRI